MPGPSLTGGAAFNNPDPSPQLLLGITDAADAANTLRVTDHKELYGYVFNAAGEQVLINGIGSNRHQMGVVTLADNHGATALEADQFPPRTGWLLEAYYPGYSLTVKIETASIVIARQLHQVAFEALESGEDVLRALEAKAADLGTTIGSLGIARRIRD